METSYTSLPRPGFVRKLRNGIILACGFVLFVIVQAYPSALNYKITEAGIAYFQQQFVTGTVADEKGMPLPGVTIQVKGTGRGTATDFDGKYTIEAGSNDILVFSFLGFKTREVRVGENTNVDVTLEEDLARLDEVVVTGYMKQKKADLTGAVATVSSEEVEKNIYSNVMQGLQGRLAGVQVTGNGSPAGDVAVQIRGLTSFRSAPPLIVIDGLPTNVNLNDISPNDIASIQVLKDAASASIYGSRAASGVILIETRKGKMGETKIDYRGSVGISSFMNTIDMLNTQQYGEAFWQAAVNDGSDPNAMTQIYQYDWHTNDNGAPVLDNVSPIEWLNEEQTMPSADTDWFGEGTRLGIQNNHSLTISSGSEKSRSLFSLNFYENQGTQIHSFFRRYSARFNSEYTLFKDRLRVGENISLAYMNLNNQRRTNELLRMPAIIPVHTLDGGWGGTAVALGMDDYWNPIRQLTMNKDNDNHYMTLIGNVYAELDLIDNLSLRTSFGLEYNAGNFRHIDFTWKEGGGREDINNGVNTGWNQNVTKTWTNTINYRLDLEKHQLDFLAGMETVKFKLDDLRGYRRDIEIEDYDYAYLNAASGTQEVYGGGDEWSLLSYFSKFNYVFDDKYLLSATVRYDGSSKFGERNQFGVFPAVSGGWRLSQEKFLAESTLISDLKLRASWGMNGNSNIPTNALVDIYDAAYHSGLHGTSYGLAGNETGNLAYGYRKIHTGNSDLKWETTTQTNIGLDFGLFDGALTGSVDYFHKYTDGMLYEPPYIAAIGEGGQRWINAANMTNTGVEFVISYFGKTGGDFSYSITGNISTYRNRIDDLPESVKYTFGGNGLDDDILGRPRNSHYGFVADGLFRTQEEVDNSPEQPGKGLGRIRYKDLNNDGRITWEHDRTWLGVSDPDFSYGLNFEAEYKNFDFSMFWQGVVGNTVWNDWKTYSDFWNVHVQKGVNHPTRILNAWSPANPDSDIPALSLINPNDELRASTYFLESGSYLKLRQVEIGYNIPESVLSKIGVQKARLSVSAQNIVNIRKWWGDDAYTGIDPESPAADAYVRPQVFLFGVNVSL
ncbi:SusC/RagA family TonB-linked outer membrane protein [Sinomicrobium weinanense]|uniref:TonB-dependent receptor n=1 Tax=Sinomicrobium weinanense TaxID=2842200 RepID=A0A926JQP0_9FLAO|nr:TonB-dependent receptor [Sinomicrobium weinanense]MBC9795722.1 TonB-dependent receptor [Sinomicrobium weinanense]MBU3125285.1 TonB-dependent receptor [Sinomicrobium weinanense]